MERKTSSIDEVTDLCLNYPVEIGWELGYDLLEYDTHNHWIKLMVYNIVNGIPYTLLAHRGSYKTTCLEIAFAIVMLLFPDIRLALFRKTGGAVKDFTRSLKAILLSDLGMHIAYTVWGTRLTLTVNNTEELDTNLRLAPGGTSQFNGAGMGENITGFHVDYAQTDDIATKKDKYSEASRNETARFYQELLNIANRRGDNIEIPIGDTGTRWHERDVFSKKRGLIQNKPLIYTVKDTGLLTEEQQKSLRDRMGNVLYSINYLLKIVSSDEDKPFNDPHILTTAESKPELLYNCIGHIDAAYSGTHHTAFTLLKVDRLKGKIFEFGKTWQKHVDDCIPEIYDFCKKYRCGTVYCEDNADKGYLVKTLKAYSRTIPDDYELLVASYNERMNKHYKIITILRKNWDNIYFLKETETEGDKEEQKKYNVGRYYVPYLEQCCDYEEGQEPDDAPDSNSSVLRAFFAKNKKASNIMSDTQV